MEAMLDKMATFVRIADTGSISRAARSLGLSVGMASRHLQWLENDLSVQLMRRTTRHVDLTEAGRAFLERARLLLADLEDAKQVVRAGDGVAGRLVLSVPACLGTGKIVPLLPKFLEQHPRLRLDLRFEDRVTDLLADGIDVAIRADVRMPDSTFIVSRKLVSYERILCGSPAFLRRHDHVSAVADLARLPCIVHGTPPETTWTFETSSGPQSVVVDERVRTDNILSIRALAVAGVGIGWLPKWLALEEFRARRLKHVLPDAAVLSPMIIYGLTHKQMRGGAAIRAVLDFLAQRLPARLSFPAVQRQ
jgi:DNA-binding transcriptional LysR family regulator